MKIKSFAKINLGLEIRGKREDNYHEVRTLLQTINFFDVLEFQPAKRDEILLKGDDKTISWERDNLIFRAALLLKEQFHVSQGIEINVKKKIPPGKGLGGGSSNAAVTLHVLNKIWGLLLGKEELMNLGRRLGADVPFFLEGGLCLGTGRGDDITPLPDAATLFCLLVLPSFSIQTAHIYSHFPLSLTSPDKDSKIIKFLDNRDFGLLENRLEETVFRFYPQLKVIKRLLRGQGSELPLVSGTGSAVFGLFLEQEKAEKVLKKVKKDYTSLLVETLPRERYWRSLKPGV
ncbi:MAG: 4-(cytidine 5'-diphospho)-2-C-methyl-D-erythritol kinase [Candidatus Aminicenantes bacterium]|nr:4-(cytidine 5'-diphospho)-2-C-methyl-D-erythritol kinase [Candidatus Aminicenantes bacterium]